MKYMLVCDACRQSRPSMKRPGAIYSPKLCGRCNLAAQRVMMTAFLRRRPKKARRVARACAGSCLP